MPTIQVSSFLRYAVLAPTSFVFQLAAQPTGHQTLLHESIVVRPDGRYEGLQVDHDGNRLIRLTAGSGELTVRYDATVRLLPQFDQSAALEERAHSELPIEVLPYLNPSRYCESDRMAELALSEFGEVPPGKARVEAICAWIRDHMRYELGSTDELTTAYDALGQHSGVCRDYAHLAIAFCRALCIPARYVSGYAVGLEPPDFHGVFEAYLGSDWYLFDPTLMAPTTGLVRIGVGRDAADTSFATIIGGAELKEMAVEARSIDGDTGPGLHRAAQAVSTA